MTEKEKKNDSGAISRREFLKDAGLVVGGTAIGSTVLLAACGCETETVTNTVTTTAPGGTSTKTETKTVSKYVCPYCSEEFDTLAELQAHIEVEHEGNAPAALNVIKLTVNGHNYEVQVKPEWSLQHLLHDELGWTDIKDMCSGYGACGSCTSIVNGRPVLSCMVLAIECDGKNIETAQGIAKAKHPIIDAYTQYHTWQCGYCTPGFVATAKALLDRNPNPTEEEIREALGGNLCRCGTYPQHIPAIKDAASKLAGGG